MFVVSTFYLSRVLQKKVYSESGKVIGKINDLIVDVGYKKPKVIALKIKKGRETKLIDYSGISVTKENGQYVFRLNGPAKTLSGLNNNTLYLKSYVLDRQLVDINGKKLVRVNDVRFALVTTGTFLMAVDVGLEGLLRRLGIAKPIKRILNLFHKSLPTKLILWDEVETVDFGNTGIRLSSVYSKLETLHASDLADIIEDMDAKIQAEFFASLNEERAADVLEEMEEEAQINVIERLPVEKAADVLEKMPSDEAADVLEAISDEKAEKLLSEMDSESSKEVRELMEYDEDEVGSIMATDYLSFGKDLTVDDTISELRKLKPEPDSIYYLYVVDENGKLISTISLRDLIVADPGIRLDDIMSKKIIYLYDTDHINTVSEIVAKYSLLAVPVVDKDMVLQGIVIIDDVVYTLLKTHKKRG
ncbi:MAG: CBS domain-containing protein [Clostridiales bacterium]|nr:CBS domain-containing protein [Clostridiales bacterium]